MANEAKVQTSLRIAGNSSSSALFGALVYQSNPTYFSADVSLGIGPTPGIVTVPVVGVNISLAGVTTPGLCRVMNLDKTNYVEYGIFDSTTNVFYPLGQILPGESYILRLSPYIGQDYTPGTGSHDGSHTCYFRFKATVAPCNVLVEVFQK